MGGWKQPEDCLVKGDILNITENPKTMKQNIENSNLECFYYHYRLKSQYAGFSGLNQMHMFVHIA